MRECLRFFGLFVLGLLYPYRLINFAIAVGVPWVSAALMIGYPRMLEPALSLIFFGNAAWAVAGWRILSKHRGARPPSPARTASPRTATGRVR